MRGKLFDSVLRLVRAERWHEQADGGGSTLAGLLLHIARHQDLAVNVVIRNHEPLFAAHCAALGLTHAGPGVGLAERPRRHLGGGVFILLIIQLFQDANKLLG